MRGRRSRERDLALQLNRRMSGGVSMGDGMAGSRWEVATERKLVCCGRMSSVGSMR